MDEQLDELLEQWVGQDPASVLGWLVGHLTALAEALSIAETGGKKIDKVVLGDSSSPWVVTLDRHGEGENALQHAVSGSVH